MRTWNHVLGPDGFRQPLTDEDFVWAVKATHHEVSRPATTAEQDAVLWTMLNRWASGKYGGGTLGEWIRTFSSTVNPLWTKRCRSDESPEDCAERQAWVAANLARPYSWYAANDPALADRVARFFRGGIAPGPLVGVVDFAAKWAGKGAEDIYWNAGIPGLPQASNAFYKEPWSLGWTAGTVRFERRAGSRLRAGLGIAALGIVAVGAILVVARRRRHVRPR